MGVEKESRESRHTMTFLLLTWATPGPREHRSHEGEIDPDSP